MFSRVYRSSAILAFVTVFLGLSFSTIPAQATGPTTTFTNLTSTPSGGIASPAFTITAHIGVDLPEASTIGQSIYFYIGEFGGGAGQWLEASGLANSCILLGMYPTASALGSSCGVSNITLTRAGASSFLGPRSVTWANGTLRINGDGTNNLFQNGDDIAVSFMPGAFTTKTSTRSGFSVYTDFFFRCLTCNSYANGSTDTWNGSTALSALVTAQAPQPTSSSSPSSTGGASPSGSEQGTLASTGVSANNAYKILLFGLGIICLGFIAIRSRKPTIRSK